jgi:hypothetical protein
LQRQPGHAPLRLSPRLDRGHEHSVDTIHPYFATIGGDQNAIQDVPNALGLAAKTVAQLARHGYNKLLSCWATFN